MSCDSSNCGGCKAIAVVLAIVFTLTTIAAAIGVYKAHFVGGMQFGTAEGSLALFALIASLLAWKKVLMACCGCEAGGCGCGPTGCGSEMQAGCGCGGPQGHKH